MEDKLIDLYYMQIQKLLFIQLILFLKQKLSISSNCIDIGGRYDDFLIYADPNLLFYHLIINTSFEKKK